MNWTQEEIVELNALRFDVWSKTGTAYDVDGDLGWCRDSLTFDTFEKLINFLKEIL